VAAGHADVVGERRPRRAADTYFRDELPEIVVMTVAAAPRTA
jgi:hypothetical protein